MQSSRASGLAKSYLFDGLDEAHLRLIESCASKMPLKAGQTLFFQQDPGDALYIVQSGSVEVSVVASSGKKLSLNLMRAGDVLGEIAALDGGPRTATATVVADSTFLRIRRSDLIDLMTKDPGLALDLIGTLCARLRWVSQQVEDLALLSTEGRLASRLIVLHHKFTDGSGDLQISQSDLADYLGVTRESTNKVLQNWRTRGVIDVSRGSISIRDHAALAEIAEALG